MAHKLDDYIISSIDKAVGKIDNPSVKDSVDWLKGNAKDILKDRRAEPTASTGLGDSSIVKRLERNSIGRMYMYVYDPKHKDTLPYYDTFPLVLIVAFTKDGFYGLNLHYVPPFVRKQILDALSKNLNRAGLSETAKVKMSYQILKRSSRFEVIKHCFKRYLMPHILSNFMFIDPAEWDKAIMLPTERFKKQSKGNIYRSYNKG